MNVAKRPHPSFKPLFPKTESAQIKERQARISALANKLMHAQRMRFELESLMDQASAISPDDSAELRAAIRSSIAMTRRAMFGGLADALGHLSHAIDAVLGDEGLTPDVVDVGLTPRELDALATLSEEALALESRAKL